jgi:pimeloyl-ACP methyl ester carboxylesterase
VARTVKLFIFKQMGRYTPDTGLHRGSLDDQGNVVYSSIQPDQFKSGDKVALFVHGFSSDTGWMIKEPAQYFRQAIGYDHVLAWDYESYGTGVHDNGEQLALALKQQCGFGPDDGITVHVFAHSLGCLVTRAMVELAGGAAFVDRVILGGPPNRGTTLASLEQGGVYLLTGLINKVSAIPPVGGANWLVQQAFQKGLGPADLAVNSPVEKQLNGLDKPDNVPYLILAGNNTQEDAGANIFQRLAQKELRKSLESLFGEANDAVIGLSSMRGMRNGAYPHLTVELMPFDHFHYFLTAEDRELIRKWIAG